MLPDVDGLHGLDVGCGDGHNTRLIAERGARITGVDISQTFVGHAKRLERLEPRGIDYQVASANSLPFDDEAFDFVTAIMSLMDVADPSGSLAEASRVLKPGGFLQFSIAHPCFDTPHRRNRRDDLGQTYAIEVGDYFKNQDGDIAEWIFSAAPESVAEQYAKFKIPRFTRTIGQWLNMLIDSGFVIERVEEPKPSEEAVREHPNLQDATVFAYFLHVRATRSKAMPKDCG